MGSQKGVVEGSVILVVSKPRIIVQDQIFPGYQDCFGKFKLQQPQGFRRISEDEGGDYIFFIYLNHKELVMPTEALGMPFFPPYFCLLPSCKQQSCFPK